jgi:hypothetical protein
MRGPTANDEPNRQASLGAQRTLAWSSAGGRPSGTNMNRVAAARTTECHRKSVPGTTKHTGCSRTHTHEHRGLWREGDLGSQLATVLGRKAGPAGGCGGGGGTPRRRPRGTGRSPTQSPKKCINRAPLQALPRQLQAALQQLPHRVLSRATPSATCTAKIPCVAPTASTACTTTAIPALAQRRPKQA